ncbi:MAG: lipid A export permease/ATP-binding protein MsbA [Neisseriaceae bacterium]|nr:lipid A export permease/ATP-binding protein MsbA [Neisseriaceae bacterium]
MNDNTSQNNKRLYGRLWKYLSDYILIFIGSILAMLVVAATVPAFAYLIKPLIDEGFVKKEMGSMGWIAAAIIGLFLVRGVFNVLNEYLTGMLSGKLVVRMRSEMFAKLQRLPISFFHDSTSGRTISRILNDAGQITEAGFNIITVLIKDGVSIVFLLGWLFYLEWKLTIATFIAIPIVGLCIQLSSKYLRHLSRENQKELGKTVQILSENISGVKMVRIYGGQQYEENRFVHNINTVFKNGLKQALASTSNTAFTQFIVSFALAGIIYFAAMQASNTQANNDFSAGGFVSFLTAMIAMFDPIKRITGVLQSMQRGLAAAESVFTFLDFPEENDKGSLKTLSAPIQGNLQLNNVCFRYPNAEKDSLSNININIQSGKTVALVGASGSGKTTLSALIARFYDISDGEILLDGKDLREYALPLLRENISLVSQDIFLFNSTIRDNIAYGGKTNASDDEVIQALKAANAWEFVAKLPDGIHTEIGENGAKLSGGQRQRIAIARAILKNAPVLILDEATSALDTESERLVQSALEKLMQNRTTIVVAHRLSTIENADEIIVMDYGKIVETGTHYELLAKKGRYAALHKVQADE